MAKNTYKKATRKALIAALCALSVSCTAVAAACTPESEDKETSKPSREDSQLLKNGSFEFFNIPDDAVYLIKNVDNWTLGGDSSVKSGIVGTSPKDWDALSDDDLSRKLEYNDDVGSSSDEYIDYNSMKPRDILYKEPYAATRTEEQIKNDNIIENFGGLQKFLGIDGNDTDGYTYGGEKVYKNADDKDFYFDAEYTKPVRKAVIENPETHLGKFEEKNGEWYLGDRKLYKGDDDTLYSDEAKENTVGNVLMVHNYATDGKYNGIRQYYTSNTITLEANTAAEISVWVKTSDLKFDKGYSTLGEQDKGATIEVLQKVNGTEIDSFAIKNINTEKIISGAEGDNKTTTAQNGWLNYKIYVNSCDFADSTIQLKLGLGREKDEQVTGYAFFDDVTVTKFRTLDDADCTYSANENKVVTCTLTSDEENKIFNADKELRETGGDVRHAYDFHYAIDLASTAGSTANSYSPVVLNADSVTASLTTEKDGKKLYASSAKNEANYYSGSVKQGDRAEAYDLVKNFNGRPTKNDLLGTFGASASFSSSMFNGIDYSTLLNDALTGDNKLPDYDGNTLVMLSSWGAAYTSTISSDNFKVAKNSYAIASFWVKTSDMNGKTAATVKIYDIDDKDDNQTLTIDTTGVTYAFETEKDIYKGWVPCFIFIENDTDNEKQFAIDFSFGNTTIKSATYEGGWVALANLQTLAVDEDVYKLATSGAYTATYSFKNDDDKDDSKVMDEALGTSDIKSEISVPSTYNGLNGANSSFTDNESRMSYDASNTNPLAGLINREYFNDYKNNLEILTSFNKAATNWDEVFGADCYQPLIIINNLRWYAEEAEANEDNVTDYYVEDENGTITAPNGKKYSRATEYNEDTKYYSLKEVVNYGFVGNNKTLSSDSYETISVKVMVSGDAEAYIYLVDSDEPENLLSYTTPSVTFYYDNEGNVLDEEFDKDWKENDHRKHIVYTLRDDGLYEKDGKVYANLYNLKKSFKNPKFEHEAFYNEEGKAVSFDNLVDGENYYTASDKATLASHYLVATDGTRVYEFKDGAYYYIVDNVTSDIKVENFDKDNYARYGEALNEPFFVKVTNTDGKWVTVNFFLHAGSESKSYRLEMWSGARNETGVKSDGTTSIVEKNGAVAFDYSSYSVSSSNYSTILEEYEENVIYAYQEALGDKLGIDAYDKNIAYYEGLVEDGTLTEAQVKAVKDKYGYTAKYYTYTLYDAESYIPFNSTTAEDGETGYDYNADDFNELLAYFEYKDEAQNSRNVFVDYSAVDQKITINTNTPDDGDDEEETTANGDIWLYVSSIVLVVVLLITLVAILVRNYLKKHRVKKGVKQRNKNVYRQRDRYIKKLHLVKTEEAEENLPVEEPENEEPAEETVEETETDEPVEETAPVEEEPAPSPVEDEPNEPNEN